MSHTSTLECFIGELDQRCAQALSSQHYILSFDAQSIGSVSKILVEQLFASGFTAEQLNVHHVDTALGHKLVIQNDLAHTIYIWSKALEQLGLLKLTSEFLSLWVGDKVANCIPRAMARLLGVKTHSVHLIAQCSSGHYWVQKRSLLKNEDPDLWDTTVGGTVQYGENPDIALHREMWEEAGLRPSDCLELSRTGVVSVKMPRMVNHVPGFQVECIDCYLALLKEDVIPVNQDGEVERFELLERNALLDRLVRGDFTTEAACALVRHLRQTGYITI